MIIDGKKIAYQIKEELKKSTSSLSIKPQLAIIMVGNDEASSIYVRKKQETATEIGISTKLFHLSENTSQNEIISLIKNLNEDKEINGIIVQLPLPEHLDTHEIINTISPLKDVDGFHPYNTGLMQNNQQPYFVAATPLGIMHLLEKINVNFQGKNVVIIGASIIVGRPLATLLLNKECTVTITHKYTKNLSQITQNADIVIAACGVANLVKKDWIKDGAILIDVGINRLNGKICGDIDFEDVKDKCDAITPVPGGVGPMTVVMLLQNTYNAYISQNDHI